MGDGDFQPFTAPRPSADFQKNLKYITISQTRPGMQNFRRLRRRGWSGRIVSLTHESLYFFVFFFASEMTYIVSGGALSSTHSPPRIRRCGQGRAFWVLEIWNLTQFIPNV